MHRYLSSTDAVKSEDLFLNKQLRQLRQCGKQKVKTFCILEINTIMWSFFKIFEKFVACSDFNGVMSDRHKMVFKLIEYQKD